MSPAAFSTYVTAPALVVMVGASLVAATVTSRVAALLAAPPLSVAVKVSVRVSVEGVSLEFW